MKRWNNYLDTAMCIVYIAVWIVAVYTYAGGH